MLRMRTPRAASTRLLPASALLRRGLGRGALVAGLLIASLPHAMAQMSLPGDFAATSTGGANYKIPIAVPPGTAGMVPSLSLEYNSQAGGSANGWLGAGLLGVDWTLAGLPAMGRCPQTVAQDGVVGAVTYTGSDRFCLEGQRLVAITSGTYGADGMEYRTEVDSFSRIISHGAAGTGPAWFEVHTKSGQVMQFGNTTDSRSLAPDAATARSWGVNRVSDTKGNYFTVSYTTDTPNNQTYPSRIDYTANDGASLAPYNSVRFVYAFRSDITPIFQAGLLMQMTMKLTNVQTYAGSTLVADYRLLYQTGSATGRSQLFSVTLCDGNSTCLPPTNFTWQNGTTTPTVINNVAGANGTLALSRPYLADFNGNGRTAIVWDNGGDPFLPYSTGTRVLWSFSGSNATFTATSTPNFAGQDGSLVGYVPLVGDYNRDGRADIWWYALSNNQGFILTYTATALGPSTMWLSNGVGTYAVNAGPTLPISNAYEFLAEGDINGDARPDLLWIHQVYIDGSGYHAPIVEWLPGSGGSVSAIPNDAGPVAASNGLPSGAWISARGTGDFNGDGFTDLLWTVNGNSFNPSGSSANGLWLSNGDGSFRSVGIPTTDVTNVAGYIPYFGDFNGDGKTDILWDLPDAYGRSNGQRYLWLSRGDGTFLVYTNPGNLNGSVVGYTATVADFNGDGLSDILWVQSDIYGRSSGAQVLWTSNGNGNFSEVSNVGGQDGTLIGYVPYVGDFNGDGKADVLWDSRSPGDSRSTGTRVIWLSDGVAPDLMTGVTNGLGATVAFTYNAITNNNGVAVYTKGTTATDPTVDVQAPMQVVSRVDKSNGIGGLYSSTYAYAGAQFDNNGRGFLGFHQVSATDLQTNIVQTTTFRQDYPYTMQVATDTKTFGSTTLSATTNTYTSTLLSGTTHYQVFLTQTQTSGTDLDGTSVLPTTTSAFTYDAYNNATQIAVSISDGSTKTTTNTFTNDTTNWFLGRLIASSVTSTAP
jgi:hypothetical protein